jgi:hypothetical protein
MSTTAPAALASDELKRGPSSTMSSSMTFGITVAVWGAIVLALAWVLPPASSYSVTIPSPQWITGL